MRANLDLVPPKPGRTPNWYIRGSYLGRSVCRSTQTSDRATAAKILAKVKRDIEAGRTRDASAPTFAVAALAYMNDGGERQFMEPILIEIGRKTLAEIDQGVIDAAAHAIAGDRTGATRNRTVYTPISAVLRHAGISLPIRRPRGAQGTPRRHWLRPDQAEKLIGTAWKQHPRFAALLTFLLYTGCRLSEALRLQVEDVDFGTRLADLRETKNGEPQRVYLAPPLVEALRRALAEPGNATWIPKSPNKPRPKPRTTGSVFCLTKSGALYALLTDVEEASGVTIPAGVSFHIFRHTYGAWARAGGVRLEDTGRWTSRGGAKPYDHFEVTDAQRVADRFPGASGTTGVLKGLDSVEPHGVVKETG